jgi:hypothetical protein
MFLGCMFVVVWKRNEAAINFLKEKQRENKSCVTSQRISACGIDSWLTK